MSTKTKIMGVLLNDKNTLTKDEILWAASHLPNTNENGDNKMISEVDSWEFKHEESDIHEALCITKEEAEKVAETMSTITKKMMIEKGYKFSHAVEECIKAGFTDKAFFPLVFAKMMKDNCDHIEKLTMRAAIEGIIGKKKKGDDE